MTSTSITNTSEMHGQDQRNDRGSILEVEIENFGPIASGKIELKPLTILMGSNNSGKSYAALLIYSIMNSEHKSIQEIMDEVVTNIENKIWAKNSRRPTSNIPPFDVQFNINVYKNFEKELRRNFASQLTELVQIKQNTCTLQIFSSILQSKITISDNTMQYPSDSNKSIHLKVGKSDQNKRKPISIKNNKIEIYINAFTGRRLTNVMRYIYKHYYENGLFVHYLPASRYGVLQSHKILAAQIVKHAPYIGLEEFHVPKMPGAVTDFLGSLLEMPVREGPCSNIAKQLEKNMLQGTIERQDTKLPTEINYRYHGQLVPLHRVSSMVSEIAPLILYLRHLVRPKSFLIIEEPESHLHPNHQIYLAKCIVDLIRNGIYVLITTHSPYLVEQIGNYLQAGGISDSDRDKLQKNKDSYLKLNELAVYLFEIEQNISKIKKVETSIEDGIDQKQFVAAFESISEHSRMIEEYYGHT